MHVSLKIRGAAAAFLCLFAGFAQAQEESSPQLPPLQILVSVADQKMMVLRDGGVVAKYPISTSKFGVGDSYGSYKTPVGRLRVCDKIGGDLSPGAVIKHRSATGEVIQVNAPGRDPIITRVIWLDGLDEENHNAKARGIYIHGTPEERNLGKPVSWGCIRMRSEDVIALYNEIGTGTLVTISPERLPHLHKYRPPPPEPPSTIIVSSTPAPAPAAKTPPTVAAKQSVAQATPPAREHLPAVSERLLAQRSTPDPNSPIARLTRESVAMSDESEAPAPRAPANPGAFKAMKGSILMAGMSEAPVLASKTTVASPATTAAKPASPAKVADVSHPVSTEAATGTPAPLEASRVPLKEIAGGLSFTEAKLRADAAQSPDTLTQSLLETFNAPPVGSLAARAENSSSGAKASQQ